MKIVKQTSGNVALIDNNKIIKVFINVNALDVVNDREIIIKYGFNQWTSIFADIITETQIDPNPPTPFNGDSYDLVDILSASFFFDLIGLNIANTSYNISGGTIGGTQPTFSGQPMFYGNYIRIGDLVHFAIRVDFDNITNFGTGQYFVTLPFNALYDYQLRDGNVFDFSTNRKYNIAGHVFANTNQLALNYIGTNGRDEPFDHQQPFVLSIQDEFHIAGTYIAQPL